MRSIQSLTRMLRLVSATSALLFSLAHGIQAAPFVEATYDLGDTTGIFIRDLSPIPEPLLAPLSSDRFSGALTIRYSSNSASGVIDGPVSLVSFHLTVDAPVYSGTNTGALLLSTWTLHLRIQDVPLSGGTLAGATVSFPGVTAPVQITGSLHCYALCAAIGVTLSVPTPIQATTPMQMLPAFLTSNGASTLTGTSSLSFTIDPGAPSTNRYSLIPITLQTNLVGREISRRAVPEPETLLLLGVGVGSIALAGGAGGWMAKRARGRRGGFRPAR